MTDISTGKAFTRRDSLKGLAAIFAAGVAPALLGQTARGLMHRNLGGRLATGGGKKLSARSYKGGDVLLLDAIENQGFDLPHQNAVLDWVDCSHGYVFRKAHGTWAWTDNALTSSSTDNFNSTASIDLGVSTNYTIEALCISSEALAKYRLRIGNSVGGTCVATNVSGYGFFRTFGTACATGSDFIRNWGCPWTVQELNEMYGYSVSVSNGHGTWRKNGGTDGKAYESDLTGSSTPGVLDLRPGFGLNPYSISAIRISSTALSADDIHANWEVDKARYGLA